MPDSAFVFASRRALSELTRRLLWLHGALLTGVCGAHCASDSSPGESTGQVVLALSPAASGGPIARAVFDLAIDSVDAGGRPAPFLRVAGLGSDDGGALTYVGTCRANPDGSPRVGIATVTLTEVTMRDGAALMPSQLPIVSTQPFLCVDGGDARLAFRFEVLASADRGFGDVTVEVDALRCASKFDCSDGLLSGPDGAEVPTLVMAVACRGIESGPVDAAIAFARTIRCVGPDGAPLDVTPVVEHAYTGVERDGAAFWNTAIGFDPDALAGVERCTVEGLAFPRSQPVGPPRGPSLRVGGPAIVWDIAVRRIEGHLDCRGAVTPRRMALRVDARPSPTDSRVAPSAAAVTLSVAAILEAEKPACADADAAWHDAEATRRDLAVARSAHDEAAAAVAAIEQAMTAIGGEVPTSFVALIDRAEAATPGDPGAAIDDLDRAAGSVERARALLVAAHLDALASSLATLDAALDALAEPIAHAGAGPEDFDRARGAALTFLVAARTSLAELHAVLAASPDPTALGVAIAWAEAVSSDALRTLSECLSRGAATQPALRLWATGPVSFPGVDDAPSPAPIEDGLLPIGLDPMGSTGVMFESACAQDAEGARLWLVARVRDAASEPDGHLVAIDLRRTSEGGWSCVADATGRCAERALAEVTCVPAP